ncbi:DNA-binding transcriptional regulator, XRE-family HTH domain [Saccharicrinis carchari]|uniref:DNA-binding transcriptional regulator, XRE-family HTH domain n=1 Tax=Saccharicrinis carchari TaxID=1168039 RepID=A0A521EXX3_SACCC|nr:helix-turn-helix transcriptional regulator [Saccharicrinis carchari]SMO88788.1 DNA-binding transcriptional regulator, XRE-family HTH domain [Saccharicrinis carchari]
MKKNTLYPMEKEFLGNKDDEPKVIYGSLYNVQLGSKIKQLREERKLTQTQFGALINKPEGNISKLENGKFNPSVEYLLKVAKALEMRLEIRFE